MDKKEILDILKKKNVSLGSYGKEIDSLRLVVEKINDRDFKGLIAVAKSKKISLDPIFKTFARKTLDYMNSGLPLRLYSYYVVKRLFGGENKRDDLIDFSGGNPLDDSKIHQLHLLLITNPFDQKEVDTLKKWIVEWNLDALQDYIWQSGLSDFLINRYRELQGVVEDDVTVQQALENSDLKEVFEESKLVDNYVSVELKNSKYVRSLKTDLRMEQLSREKAAELLKQFYALFAGFPGNTAEQKGIIAQLNMKPLINKLEKRGIELFREYVEKNWAAGAEEVARIYNFSFPEDRKKAGLATVNNSFKAQAKASNRGKMFLCTEGILNRSRVLFSAAAYALPGRYLLVALSPRDDETHYLFGHYPSRNEQQYFIMKWLANYYYDDDFNRAAQRLINEYFSALSGDMHFKNAVRYTLYALPVVIIVSVALGLVYNYFVGHPVEAFILGAILAALGLGISAMNGFKKKVKPESHEKIPNYVVREMEILKIKPAVIESA